MTAIRECLGDRFHQRHRPPRHPLSLNSHRGGAATAHRDQGIVTPTTFVPTGPLAPKAKNWTKSAFRAHDERPFPHIKRRWGYTKLQYRELVKNANSLIAMCALYNVRHSGIVLAG